MEKVLMNFIIDLVFQKKIKDGNITPEKFDMNEIENGRNNLKEQKSE